MNKLLYSYKRWYNDDRSMVTSYKKFILKKQIDCAYLLRYLFEDFNISIREIKWEKHLSTLLWNSGLCDLSVERPRDLCRDRETTSFNRVGTSFVLTVYIITA